MRKISSRNSLLKHFIPGHEPSRESHFPVQLEASSMPANESLRLNEGQGSLPSRPEVPQHNPKESVGAGKSWPRAMPR